MILALNFYTGLMGQNDIPIKEASSKVRLASFNAVSDKIKI
jgi:hypothetical protein